MKKPAEPMIIAIRANSTRLQEEARSPETETRSRRTKRRNLDIPSRWLIVFDAETTTNHAQRLRFAPYQVLEHTELCEKGICYEPTTLAPDEVETLRQYCSEKGYAFRAREEFVRDVLLKYGYAYGGQIVGFNLPFDLSRLAIESSTSHGRDMRGGFSFKLRHGKRYPAVLIKHLNSRSAFMRFAAISRQVDGRSSRKKGYRTKARHGFFLDVKTLAAALLGKSHTLASLADALQTENRKTDGGEHGAELTTDYIDYAVNDVQVTLECYQILCDRYSEHRLTDTPAHRIYSEASMGKGYLRQMQIAPWKKLQSDFPPELTGIVASTFSGGRAEIGNRREITRVLYCDFRSMYPTFSTLMGLWQFVIAKGVNWSDSTEEARTLLEQVDLEQLQDKAFWRSLHVLVRAEPAYDIFPVRAAYSETSRTIGLNYLTADFPLWYTLADCIASKILTGKAPKVIEAIRFSPKEPQQNLKPISIGGDYRFSIDPLKDDFYRRVIEMRGDIQRKAKAAKLADQSAEFEKLNSYQQMLKLLANSTNYGIFAEINVQSYDETKAVCCYGSEGSPFDLKTHSVEEPGSHFHPLIATLITGAARLMLAIAERVAADNGIGWCFCDTDSLALARPNFMDDNEFIQRAECVTSWFDAINPYDDDAALFKVEDENFQLTENGVNKKQHVPLYAYAISAKRYALFNLGEDGKPIIRKALAHGLGHLLPPYSDVDAPNDIPMPACDLRALGIHRWHHDLWYLIVEAALAEHPDEIDLDRLPNINGPAASKYAASSPKLLSWFSQFNEDREPNECVHPFNFMLSFQTSKTAIAHTIANGEAGIELVAKGTPAPVAAYDNNTMRAAQSCFDRKTKQAIPTEFLVPYRNALAQYHLRSEAKFENAEFSAKGKTVRRHVYAVAVEYIGKEANRWEEQFHVGEIPDAQIEYGFSPEGNEKLVEVIDRAAKKFGKSELARSASVSRQQLISILGGRSKARPKTIRQLLHAVNRLERERIEYGLEQIARMDRLRQEVKTHGAMAVAWKLSIDPSNLTKMLKGERAVGDIFAQSAFSVESDNDLQTHIQRQKSTGK